MKRIILLAALTTLVSANSSEPNRKLPRGWKLGGASSAYQIEGAWNASGKTPSIWDKFCTVPGNIADGTNGKEACKSYEYYKRDIAMVKFLKMDYYRFSLSWPRILPTGYANKISAEGTAFYNKLINTLLENGIEPVVTIYHWDLPQNLQDLGGWASPLISKWFRNYAKVVFDLFGDRVKTWITLNEPHQIGLYGYGQSRFAPGINAHGIGEYIVAKNMMIAHARVWHLYNNVYRRKQKGVCGITINTEFREGKTDDPEDIQAAADSMDFEVGLYSHPIFSEKGGFPESVVRIVGEKSKKQGFPESRLPKFSKTEINYVKGTSDFYGFNHYSTNVVTRKSYVASNDTIPSMYDDIGVVSSVPCYKMGPIPFTPDVPCGVRKALQWVKKNCQNPEIRIFENGYGEYDGDLVDKERIHYFTQYLSNILDAIEIDDCNVVSYTVWSVMDNFEWASGFEPKFGLFKVDIDSETKTRTPRASAFWFQDLAASRTLKPLYIPEVKHLEF